VRLRHYYPNYYTHGAVGVFVRRMASAGSTLGTLGGGRHAGDFSSLSPLQPLPTNYVIKGLKYTPWLRRIKQGNRFPAVTAWAGWSGSPERLTTP
jgi:hypothetical protein